MSSVSRRPSNCLIVIATASSLWRSLARYCSYMVCTFLSDVRNLMPSPIFLCLHICVFLNELKGNRQRWCVPCAGQSIVYILGQDCILPCVGWRGAKRPATGYNSLARAELKRIRRFIHILCLSIVRTDRARIREISKKNLIYIQSSILSSYCVLPMTVTKLRRG